MLDAPYIEGGVWQDTPHRYRPTISPDRAAIKKAVQMMKAAKRPVIYGGGGLINSGPEATANLRRLVEVTGWPSTLTLMG